MRLFFSCICILSYTITIAQLLDLTRSVPYAPVFSETDDFDSSYLTQLEKIYYGYLPDTIRMAVGNDLAYYWHTRNLDKANILAHQVLSFANLKHSEFWAGRLQVTLGAILLRQEKLDSAYAMLETAKTKLQRNDWSLLLTQLGYVYERKGELSIAAEYALEGLKLGDSTQDLKTQAMALSDLSNLFWKQSKFEQGLQYGLQSEALFKQRGLEDMDYSFTLYVIGNNYMYLHDYPNAEKYFSLALAQSDRYQFYNNLADIYIALCELYTMKRDFEIAAIQSKKAIQFSTLLDNHFMLMRSWLSLAKVQNLMHQPDASIKSINTCLQIATVNFGDEFFLNQAYKELSIAFASKGQYKEAYEAFKQFDTLKDSVFTIESDQRVSKLQTEFEVAQKESTIKTQQVAIAQQKRFQILLYGALSLLGVILTILYRNYRIKRILNAKLESVNNHLEQKNIQLDDRNSENELLLKEIHHRVKNNLEIVSGLLELQAAQSDSPSAQAVMQASQNRVQSMGIIHQKLYQKENLATIEMKDYFAHLAESILDTFNATDRIKINCDMAPMELDVDVAIPMGLIANELITNSLKYAFDSGPGQMVIGIQPAPKSDRNNSFEWVFFVVDNGKGFTQNDKPQGTGFGTNLIHLLVKQLEGRLEYELTHGSKVLLYFNT
jgi:two-component sensor histidine kinase